MGEVCPNGTDLKGKAGLLAERALSGAIFIKKITLDFLNQIFFRKIFGGFTKNPNVLKHIYIGEVSPLLIWKN